MIPFIHIKLSQTSQFAEFEEIPERRPAAGCLIDIWCSLSQHFYKPFAFNPVTWSLEWDKLKWSLTLLKIAPVIITGPET